MKDLIVSRIIKTDVVAAISANRTILVREILYKELCETLKEKGAIVTDRR